MPSKKYLRMAEMYKRFTWCDHDFSDKALKDMYMFESTGSPKLGLSSNNGYLIGKHWMDATIKMWNKDLKEGLLFRWELDYPKWFLDKVLKM